jgi:predicted O-methyltransferase YrrM
MSNRSVGLSQPLHDYLMRIGVREAPLLRRLRDETAALPQHDMQIAPEQGAFMALIVELMGARRCFELGTFTGYSSLAVAMALPADGRIVCLDLSEEWTSIARRYWREAGVEDRVDLRLGPAIESLDAMLREDGEGSYDFCFIDAAKEEYEEYYERALRLLRPGGLMTIDNVFMGGEVLETEPQDEGTRTVVTLNERIATDDRVSLATIPLADGLTLVLKRAAG